MRPLETMSRSVTEKPTYAVLIVAAVNAFQNEE